MEKQKDLGAAAQGVFTPGPWKLESESRDPDGSDLVVTDGDGGYTIASCRSSSGVANIEEAEANARLIAAAPALADALAGVFGLVEDGTLVRGVDGDHHPDYVPKALRLVTALKQAQDALRAAGRLP